jgi:hypothetical protein
MTNHTHQSVSTQEFFDFIRTDRRFWLASPPWHAAWGGGFPIKVNGEVVGAQSTSFCTAGALRPSL